MVLKKYNVTMEEEEKEEWFQIYIFYADVYLLQNLWMDFIALAGAKLSFAGGKGKKTVVLLHFLSSIGTLIITLTVTEPFAGAILIHFCSIQEWLFCVLEKVRGVRFWKTGQSFLSDGHFPWRGLWNY